MEQPVVRPEYEVKEEKELKWHPEIAKWRTDQSPNQGLMENIRSRGQLQNIVARELPSGELEGLAGHRRYLALQALGKKTSEMGIAVMKDVSDEEALLIALSENSDRSDFSPIEEARAFESLRKMRLSVEAIAEKVHRSESYVRDRLALLELPKAVQKPIDEGSVEVSYAIPLKKLDGFEKAQLALVKKIASKNYDQIKSVKEAEAEVTRVLEAKKEREQIVIKYGPCPSCGSKNIESANYGNTKDKVHCNDCKYEWNAETKDPWQLYELKRDAKRLGLDLEVQTPDKATLTPEEVTKIVEERREVVRKEEKPNPSFRSKRTVEQLLAPLIADDNVLSMHVEKDTVTLKLIKEPNLYFIAVKKPYRTGEQSRITVEVGWHEDEDIAHRMYILKKYEESLDAGD